MAENLQVGLKWSVVHSSRQRRTAIVPYGLGSTGQLFMCSRMHGESCNCADSGGRGGQPWRRSRPNPSKVHEVDDVEAVTHIL